MLLHGWAGSFERTWRRSGLVDLLSEAGRTVVPYDLPGHGTAHKSHEPRDYAHLAKDLLTHVARTSDAQPPIAVDAVGFSLGAVTLLRAMLLSPQSFNKVVLAGIGDGVFFPHEPSRSERILSGLEGRAEPGDVVARLFGKIGNEGNNDALALAAVLRRPREEPMGADQLASINNEVTIVLGDQDFSAPADQLVAAFPNSRFVSLSGIDHFRTPESFAFIDEIMSILGE